MHDEYVAMNQGLTNSGITMGKIKIARIILSALSAVITAAKAVVDFIKCIDALKTEIA